MSSCHEPVYVDFNTMMTDDQERVWIHPSEARHWFRPGLRVHLWAEDGTLLGTASQSAVVRRPPG